MEHNTQKQEKIVKNCKKKFKNNRKRRSSSRDTRRNIRKKRRNMEFSEEYHIGSNNYILIVCNQFHDAVIGQ